MPERAFKSHNPKGVEPDLHGGLSGLSKEVMDKFQEGRAAQVAGAKRFTYDEAYEYLKRGEGDALGHYIYEMITISTKVSRTILWTGL